MSSNHIFPLERALKARASNRNESPNHLDDLYERYIQILAYLQKEVYPFIDVGLAALSEENGVYTLHDSNHFDEVVKYAGQLVGCTDRNAESFERLIAYELFVLLVAIRIHDAGNMYGRERHERRPFAMLQAMGPGTWSDMTEAKFIADIARAHGGKAIDGTKNTIDELNARASYGTISFQPRELAAIVRFADEICERRNRAANILLENERLGKNEVFHKYAASISSVRVLPTHIEGFAPTDLSGLVLPQEVNIEFNLNNEDCLKKWGKTEDGRFLEVYLIDEITDRLEKMFREREYCNKYMRKVCDVVYVKATINIWEEVREDGIEDRQIILTKSVISQDEGYPTTENSIRIRYKLDGESLIAELNSSRTNNE